MLRTYYAFQEYLVFLILWGKEKMPLKTPQNLPESIISPVIGRINKREGCFLINSIPEDFQMGISNPYISIFDN